MPPTLPAHQWLTAQDRVVVLAHGRWGPGPTAKTGIQIVRYARARTIAVVDPEHAGPDADAAAMAGLPDKGFIPLRSSLEEVLAQDGTPTRVVVGIAPPGGRLPDAMRSDIRYALEHRIPVISGLHTFISDDPEFAALAERHNTPLVDLRRPAHQDRITDGSGRAVPVPVVLTVGTDCSCGKMTVGVALREAARAVGLRFAFVATGQTGLLMEPDAGAPVDRLIIDFAAGEVERQVVAAAHLDAQGQRTPATPDLILVEGQGALSHPSYAQVSLALLLGAWPDALIMCHPAGRPHKTVPTKGPVFPILPIPHEIRLNETYTATTTGARVAAICTADFGAGERYRDEMARIAAESELPVFDVLRGGAAPLLDALIDHLAAEPNGKRVPLRRPAQ